jgi:hypothetical protein
MDVNRECELVIYQDQYTITLNKENGFAHVFAWGELTKSTGEAIITQARTEAAKHHYNIFCDARQMTIKAGLADWFFLPRKLDVYKNRKTRYIKTAILIDPGNQARTYRFFEMVTQNLGLNIRIFLEESSALAWLSKMKKKERQKKGEA